MAHEPPASIDVQEIQFKLQNKHTVFAENATLRSNVDLLAVASSLGLLFVGNPNAPNFQALLLQTLVAPKATENDVLVRKVRLLGIPNLLACNAGDTMLAVNYTSNDCDILEIYNVLSFTSSIIKSLYNIRLSPHEKVCALQLLWNPVIPTSIAVIHNDGSLTLYSLKDGGAFEMQSLDKSQRVKCGCWSPKGKQIVLGLEGGVLKQFKPDLTPVKTITCPASIHPGPSETIAVHWLSTFQFAVVFLQRVENAAPSIYIVNAPKGANPAYINYNDICYSGSGPRKHHFFFTHIQQWNLLLVASANGVEVGVLGTQESNELPTWVHYMLIDEARIEMPLTNDSDETYPIGIVLDTSSSHQLTVGERKLSTMPMMHVLTTHGQLLCFNFLNLSTGAVNICSVPSPINYDADLFQALKECRSGDSQETGIQSNTIKNHPITEDKHKTIDRNETANFGESKPTDSTTISTNSLASIKLDANNTQFNCQKPVVSSKPLYTLPATFTPNTNTIKQAQNEVTVQPLPNDLNLDTREVNVVIKEIIVMHIVTFDNEVKQLRNKSKEILIDDVNISTIKSYSNRLINMNDVFDQANERDFLLDIQDLRNSFNEAYKMITECRSKLDMYKDPDSDGLNRVSVFDCISQRQLSSLRSYLAINQVMLQQLQEKVDSRWASYQDLMRRNAKTQMQIPCLDGVFQRLTKFKVLVAQQRAKLNYLKTALKRKYIRTNQIDESGIGPRCIKSDATMESLADSVLSMSFCHSSDVKSYKLPDKKLQAIRSFTCKQEKIAIIKPKRPMRAELTSEVILESKALNRRKENDGLQKNASKLNNTESNKTKVVVKESQSQVIKPTTSECNISQIKSQPAFIVPTLPQVPFPTFSFGSASPFTKTISTSINRFENDLKPFMTKTGGEDTDISRMQPLNFVDMKPTPVKSETIKDALAAPPIQTPILFSPKVIDGDAIKKPTNVINESVATSSYSQPVSVASKLPISISNSDAGFSISTVPPRVFDKPHDSSIATLSTSIAVTSTKLNNNALGAATRNVPHPSTNENEVAFKPKHINTEISHDSDNTFVETLNVCKPTQKATDTTASNVGFGTSCPINTTIAPVSGNQANAIDLVKLQAASTTTTVASTIATPTFGTKTTSTTAASFNFNAIAITTSNTTQNATTTTYVTPISSQSSSVVPTWSPISPSTTASNTIFSATNTVSSSGGSIFGGISKLNQLSFTDQTSPKSDAPSTVFTATTVSTETKPSPFSGVTMGVGVSNFGNIFGCNSNSFNSATTSNIFGGGSSANIAKPLEIATNNTNVSIFGGEGNNPSKSPENTSIFGLLAQNNVSGGSIFGGSSTFGKSDTNIFASNTNTPTSNVQKPSEFSFGSSVFRNTPISTTSTGGYLFGSGVATVAEAPSFGSPSAGGFGANSQSASMQAFGSFAHGGGSVASVGFGSSIQQPNTFVKPIFGGTAAFSSSPTFGGQPNFGGAPTFGSPKGFGSFATPNTPSPGLNMGDSASKSNIFEALGSIDTGLSFGNLAQTTNQTSNTPKPTFGGSSFMNYRA